VSAAVSVKGTKVVELDVVERSITKPAWELELYVQVKSMRCWLGEPLRFADRLLGADNASVVNVQVLAWLSAVLGS
jgi:hypothetical protein